MKKYVVLALGTVVMIGLLVGCSGSESSFQAKNYTSDAQVSGVCVDVSDREIEVSLSSDDSVQIDYFESDETFYSIALSEDGILTMTTQSNEGISKFFGVKSSGEEDKIFLQIPSGLLTSLEIHTTNENISLGRLTVPDCVTLTNNHGDISFDALDVGSSLQIETKNGDITGTVVGSYDDFTIHTESKKGESNLPDTKEGGNKVLQVKNNNGDIEITFIE